MDATIKMDVIQCAACGIPFGISSEKVGRLRKCHNTFYCPDGHAQSFPAKSDEEKLREQISLLKQENGHLKEKVQKKSRRKAATK